MAENDDSNWLANLPTDLAAHVAELRQRHLTEHALIIAITQQAWLDNEAHRKARRQGGPSPEATPDQRLNQLLPPERRAAAWRHVAEQRLPLAERDALRQQRAIEAELTGEPDQSALRKRSSAKGRDAALEPLREVTGLAPQAEGAEAGGGGRGPDGLMSTINIAD